jgi:hypothetical protein
MGEIWKDILNFLRKPQGKRSVASPRRRCEDHIKVEHKETEWEIIGWIHLERSSSLTGNW